MLKNRVVWRLPVILTVSLLTACGPSASDRFVGNLRVGLSRADVLLLSANSGQTRHDVERMNCGIIESSVPGQSLRRCSDEPTPEELSDVFYFPALGLSRVVAVHYDEQGSVSRFVVD